MAMSAFLVSMRTINQIVATLSSLLRSHEYTHAATMFAASGIDTTQAHWEEALANAMFALNQEALYQRYGDPAEEQFVYKRVPALPNLYQVLKSINCWLYQCTEGNVPESKLYQFFKTFVRVWLMEIIIHQSSAYDEAQWD
jgi:hypothetical protein